MNPGEVHLAVFPFGGRVGAKLRPVLLLTGPVGPVPEVLAAYMSTIIPPVLLSTDILIDPSLPDHASTHLKATSVLRLHKLATVHASDIVRHLGQLSPATWADVQARLRVFLNL
jgi:mRNA interferase MazF